MLTPGTETGTRTHRNRKGTAEMSKRKGILRAVPGTLALVESTDWEHKPPVNGRPEMWRGKVAGVEIWLKGVKPPKASEPVVGLIEVKTNEVTQRRSEDESSFYLYVNVLPLPQGSKPTATVAIVRPEKVGEGANRRKVTPSDFDPLTDYFNTRGREVWQVITIRGAEPVEGLKYAWFVAYETNEDSRKDRPAPREKMEALRKSFDRLDEDGETLPGQIVQVETGTAMAFYVVIQGWIDPAETAQVATQIYEADQWRGRKELEGKVHIIPFSTEE